MTKDYMHGMVLRLLVFLILLSFVYKQTESVALYILLTAYLALREIEAWYMREELVKIKHKLNGCVTAINRNVMDQEIN